MPDCPACGESITNICYLYTRRIYVRGDVCFDKKKGVIIIPDDRDIDEGGDSFDSIICPACCEELFLSSEKDVIEFFKKTKVTECL